MRCNLGKVAPILESNEESSIDKASSQIKGKIGEYQFIGELLRRNLDVYLPIADIRGIDCIVRSRTGKYIEIQVKTRVTSGVGKGIFDFKDFKPRNSFFLACKREDWEKFWILPSKVVWEHSRFLEKYRRRRFILNQKKRNELRKYEDDFHQLEALRGSSLQPSQSE